jgi:hypothetical protein
MSKSYRFVRLDSHMRPRDEITLVCASPEDALLLASSLGDRVEVWDGASRIGVIGSAAAPTGGPASAPPTQTGAPPPPDATFNPFRPGVWRARRGPS